MNNFIERTKNDARIEIDEFGNKIWLNDLGQLHREDGPAI